MKQKPAPRSYDVVLVHPPFAYYHLPCFALSLLKAICEKNGITCKVYYANLQLNSICPENLYTSIASTNVYSLLGDYLFARYAFPGLEKKQRAYEKKYGKTLYHSTYSQAPVSLEQVSLVHNYIPDFLQICAKDILRNKPRIVGIHASSHQLTAALAIARIIKKKAPHITTTLGGYQAWGEPGMEILKNSSAIDYVFSGESEIVFADWCKKIITHAPPTARYIPAQLYVNLDSLPYPDYSDFFRQVTCRDPAIPGQSILMETSRGCWWGQKQRCLFCGGLGANAVYRQKSMNRIEDEVTYLTNTYRMKRVIATDNVIPKNMGKTFMKKKKKPVHFSDFYYEIRPDYSYSELSLMKKNGMNLCQAGIETLSTRLLKILHKGVRAIENIRFLRDCKTLGIHVLWNFLYSIPGEKDKDYLEMFDMFPLLSHLNPPGKVIPLAIQRFSPLFTQYKTYGITELKPLDMYKCIFPEQADIMKLATYFKGENMSGINNTIQQRLKKFVKAWQEKWTHGTQDLRLVRLPGEQSMLIDTRGINKKTMWKLDEQYITILAGLQNPVKTDCVLQSPVLDELISKKCVMRIQNEYISLVTGTV